jgi:hypothetical protein
MNRKMSKLIRNNTTLIAKGLLLCIAIILSLILCGCYTQKKATKAIIKAQTNYPNVVSKFCGNLYPPKDSTVTEIKYVEGEPMFFTDTILVNCDSVVKAAQGDKLRGGEVVTRRAHIPQIGGSNPPPATMVKVPTGKSVRVDTVYREKQTYRSNKAHEDYLSGKIDSLIRGQTVTDSQLIKTRTKLRALMWLSLILLAYFALKVIIRIYVPKFSNLLKFMP